MKKKPSPKPRGHRQSEREADLEYWERQRKRGPYRDGAVYAFADAALDGETIRSEQIHRALSYLWLVTDDEAFLTAALALENYGLHEGGGLQANTKELLRRSERTIEHAIAVRMGGGTLRDAEKAVAQYGVPGQSFSTVVREVLRARRRIEQRWKEQSPDPQFPTGDTGRNLLVRVAGTWLGEDNQRIRSLLGIEFDADGFAVVPEDREWRRLISKGLILSLGVLTYEEPEEASRRRAFLEEVAKDFPKENSE